MTVTGRSGIAFRLPDTREREMRVEPGELAIVQLGVECNFVSCIFRNVEAEVRGVGGAGRDQMDVNNRASRPGISFVNGIAVAIDLERAIEVRTGFDRAFAVIFDFAAPENALALFVRGLQFEPDIKGVHGATGEEVADLAGADDHIHANVIAAADGGLGAIYGCGDGANFAGRALRQ